MKKLRLILGAIVVVALAYCIANDLTSPLKTSPDWHPAWWQSRWLHGTGLFVLAPIGLMIAAARDSGVHNETILSVIFFTSVTLTILGVAAVIAFVGERLVWAFGTQPIKPKTANQSLQPTGPSARG